MESYLKSLEITGIKKKKLPSNRRELFLERACSSSICFCLAPGQVRGVQGIPLQMSRKKAFELPFSEVAFHYPEPAHSSIGRDLRSPHLLDPSGKCGRVMELRPSSIQRTVESTLVCVCGGGLLNRALNSGHAHNI